MLLLHLMTELKSHLICFLPSHAAASMLWVRQCRESGLIRLEPAFTDAVIKLEILHCETCIV